jgi:hypothetical protein
MSVSLIGVPFIDVSLIGVPPMGMRLLERVSHRRVS